jgi:DNA-binding NtrC family response regulator
VNEAVAADTDPPAEPLQGARVLIIEDEMLIAMDFQDILARQGCEVLGPINSVARALRVLSEQRPDAALLDLNLDGDPTTAVAEALHRCGVPFVIITGYGSSRPRVPALRDAPCLDKPVGEKALVRCLEQVLRGE